MALHAIALCFVAMPIGYWLGDRMEKPGATVPVQVARILQVRTPSLVWCIGQT